MPDRVDDLEEAITVRGPEGLQAPNALQDEWYEDLMPASLGRILRDGAQWEHVEESGECWSLAAGRDIYVLASRPERGVYGFVTTTRLLLNEDQVVLCTKEQETAVRHELAVVGCPAPSSLDERNGVPAGWLLFTDVRPTVAVPHDPAADILNVLRPLHEVDIVLSGGIRIERMKWLCGHPPRVRLRGEHESLEVIIDQQIATRQEDNSYIIPGWDALGFHRVFCGGNADSYEIVAAPVVPHYFALDNGGLKSPADGICLPSDAEIVGGGGGEETGSGGERGQPD